MVYAAFEELNTDRLRLRKFYRTDAENFFRFAGSASVTKFMLWNPHANVAESAASIEKSLSRYENGRYYRWAVALQENDTLIGIIDLLGFDEARNTCSFAYMLAEDHWGRGFGPEALKAVLDFAFRELKVSAVEADHFAENAASGAVMRKVGMQYCGTIPEKYEKDGITYHAPQYRMTVEERNHTVS